MLRADFWFRFTATLAALLPAAASMASPANWPSFRGPRASGIADGQNPPTVWDAEKGINIKWKTAIPGLGHSSPVVWGDRVFVTSAVGTAVATLIGILSVPGLIAAYGLSKRRNWGRYFALILGAMNVFNLPFGTALAVYTFWVLTQDEAIRAFN